MIVGTLFFASASIAYIFAPLFGLFWSWASYKELDSHSSRLPRLHWSQNQLRGPYGTKSQLFYAGVYDLQRISSSMAMFLINHFSSSFSSWSASVCRYVHYSLLTNWEGNRLFHCRNPPSRTVSFSAGDLFDRPSLLFLPFSSGGL